MRDGDRPVGVGAVVETVVGSKGMRDGDRPVGVGDVVVRTCGAGPKV